MPVCGAGCSVSIPASANGHMDIYAKRRVAGSIFNVEGIGGQVRYGWGSQKGDMRRGLYRWVEASMVFRAVRCVS